MAEEMEVQENLQTENPTQKEAIKVEISFSEEELVELVASITNAPTGGYQNVSQNKKVYSLPTKKLANMVAQKVNKALDDACGRISAESATRAAEDGELSSEIKAVEAALSLEQNSRIAAEAEIEQAIKSEEEARKAEDVELLENDVYLRDAINVLKSRIGAAEAGGVKGIATLDESGKVPASQLPSYVDDVIEGGLTGPTTFYQTGSSTPIVPEKGKIYLDVGKDISYRWSETQFVEISRQVPFGKEAGTAYEGSAGADLEFAVSIHDSDISGLRGDTAWLREDVSALNEEAKGGKEQLSALSSDVEMLKETLDVAEITSTVEIEDSFNSRQTAGGLTLVPGQPAKLLKVEGDTIACRNLFNPNRVERDFGERSDSTLRAFEKNSLYRGVTGNNWYYTPMVETFTYYPDGSFDLSLTANGAAAYGIGFNFECVGNESYSIQFVCAGQGTAKLYIAFYDENGGLISGSTGIKDGRGTFVTPSNAKHFLAVFSVEQASRVVRFTNIQVEKGSEPTEYQPYFEGLKSASFAGVESRGKNLFNPNRTFFNSLNPGKIYSGPTDVKDFSNLYLFERIAASGYYSIDKNNIPQYKDGVLEFVATGGGYGAGFNIPCLPNKKYAISFKNLSDTVPTIGVGFYENDVCTMYLDAGSNGVTRLASPKNCNQLVVLFHGDAGVSYKITDIQVEIGEAVTEYTPYVEPSLFTFPSTEGDATATPLGTTIDFEQKKIVDYGVELVLTGNERIRYYTSYNSAHDNGVEFEGILGNVNAVYLEGVSTDGQVVYANNRRLNDIWIGVYSPSIYWVGILDVLGFTTAGVEPTEAEKTAAVNNFKAYLAQRKDVNPVTIRYVTSTVQSETPFTAEQESAGNSYLTHTGGVETVLGNNESEYSVKNTLTHEYDIINK